jgi:hypothetical protein
MASYLGNAREQSGHLMELTRGRIQDYLAELITEGKEANISARIITTTLKRWLSIHWPTRRLPAATIPRTPTSSHGLQTPADGCWRLVHLAIDGARGGMSDRLLPLIGLPFGGVHGIEDVIAVIDIIDRPNDHP